ncbi:hypothetical protein [Nocardioides sp. zg-DK7169]|uniref:hypothetical protein n=1 Tax=Nocardioides sp. zg-DK7169 TaxID=2736600 RepID=UPI0015541F7A|nr:hypothetical protein [Nocardioides sp. zg-DK7169]NPC98867.1 hypothetical protein [Nocardioides sp. zg-DK7169]
MRFVLLMAEEDHFARWESADAVLRERVVADFAAFDRAVQARGSILAGEALEHPATARTVRPGADRPVAEVEL